MKAPAFQFYYDRFMGATISWEDHQVGQLIRLMCIQGNKGFVTQKDINKMCPSHDEDVLQKFPEIEAGKFANPVLSGILAQREAYSLSRAENRKKGNTSKSHDKDMNIISESHDEDMVVVDKVVVKVKDKKQKKEKPEIKITLPTGWPESEVMPLVEVWVKNRKKPTSNELIQIRVNELAAKKPDWKDAMPQMREAGLESWLKFVYPDKNGIEPKKAPATRSDQLIRDKA